MSKKKILLVDDEWSDRMMTKPFIEEVENINLQMVGSGKEALKVLEKEKFDLIITDNLMPEMIGIVLIQKIRQNVSEGVPIILISTSEPGDMEYFQKSLVFGFISKMDLREKMTSTIKGILF